MTLSSIIERIKKNERGYTSVDLRGITKDKNLSFLIAHLPKAINSNSHIGHIHWGSVKKQFKEVVEKVERAIIRNNMSYNYHPTVFMLCLLTLHGFNYEDEIDEPLQLTAEVHNKWESYLKGWTMDYVEKDEESGFVAYIYKKGNQIVFVPRGTKIRKGDMFSAKDSPIQTVIHGIIEKQIVRQQMLTYAMADKLRRYAEQKYDITLTGHSLGGWLSQLCLYYCQFHFNIENIKAVVFDSPGVSELVSNSSNIINYATRINVDDLDITNYVTVPNMVNCCNKHIGKVYRIFPTIKKPENYKGVFGDGIGLIFQGVTVTQMSHQIEPMLEEIDPQSGLPKEYKLMKNWPHMNYGMGSKKHKKTFAEAIEQAQRSIPLLAKMAILDKVKKIALKFSMDKGIFSLCRLIMANAKGKIDRKQIEQVLNQCGGERYEIREDISLSKQFDLVQKGKYETQEIKNILNTKNVGSEDWYLNRIKKLEGVADDLVDRQLQIIRSAYKIDIWQGKKTLILVKDRSFDQLKWHIRRLKTAVPNLYEMVTQPRVIKEVTSRPLTNNLPQIRPSYFIERRNLLSSIDTLLNNNVVPILFSQKSSGKSVCAIDYALTNKDKKGIRWFSSDERSKVINGYRIFAEICFDMKSMEIADELLIEKVHATIAKEKLPYLFIFDNVTSYDNIASFLAKLPPTIKALITTRNEIVFPGSYRVDIPPFTTEQLKECVRANLAKALGDSVEKCMKCITASTPLRLVKCAIAQMREKASHKIFKKIIKKGDKGVLHSLDKNSVAWKMLMCSAFLDKEFIPLKVLEVLCTMEKEKITEDIGKLSPFFTTHIMHDDYGEKGVCIGNQTKKITQKYLGSKKSSKKQKIELVRSVSNLIRTHTRIKNSSSALRLIRSQTEPLKVKGEKS